MPYAIIQAGDDLQFLNTAGELSPVNLPAGVTLATDKPPRWVVMNRYIILCNTPNRVLTIDGAGSIRLLAPAAPTTAPTLTAASGGSLTGTYDGIRYSFIVKDADGEVIGESGFSPAAPSISVTNQFIYIAGIEISPDYQD